MQQMKIH